MRSCLTALALTALTASGEPSNGHADAVWLAEQGGATDGPIRSVIKLTIEEGWHTYWVNPGEGGMPLSVKWDLSEGWTAGDIQHPTPKRFLTGELPGFGYEGAVFLPVDLTPPPSHEGAVTLSGRLSWLTCNDSSCVPGSAKISLQFGRKAEAGEGNNDLIEKAYKAIPQPLSGASLQAEVEGEEVIVRLTLPTSSTLDLTTCEVFPMTRNVIDPAAEPRFSALAASPQTWRATAPKSEYLEGQPESLTLVLSSQGQPPVLVSTQPK